MMKESLSKNDPRFEFLEDAGGFFEQAEKRVAVGFAEASKPGGFFVQAEKRVIVEVAGWAAQQNSCLNADDTWFCV